MIRTITCERRHILLVAISLCFIGYIYLTPPVSQLNLISRLGFNTGWSGDYEFYIQRFILAFMLFGVIPVTAARFCGYRLSDLGLRKPECKNLVLCLISALGLGAVFGVGGSFSAGTSQYYPYDGALVEKVAAGGPWPFLLHLVLYGFLFYLPWEIVFRGALIFPLLDEKIENVIPTGRTLFLASIQVIPSSLLHFGHPIEETIGAVIFGFFAGWLTVKTRSIIPALIIHAATGIFLDMTVVLSGG